MLRVLFYLLIIAAVIYAVFWSINRRNAGPEAGGPTSGPPARPQPRGPRGPDDDEDFLRELDRKRKQRPDGDPSS